MTTTATRRATSRRFGLWTALGLGSEILPWVLGVIPKPDTYGCGNPFGAMQLLSEFPCFLSSVLAPVCLAPAIFGYIIANNHATTGGREGVIPHEALFSYVSLCIAVTGTVVWHTFLLFVAAQTPVDVVLFFGLAGIAMVVLLFFWSIAIGVRLARVGKAVQIASHVCVHCGFAVRVDAHLPCRSCGGEVRATCVATSQQSIFE